MKKNIQRLGATLADRMKQSGRSLVPITAELGTINRDLSLTVDSIRTRIPKGDYMVNIALSSDSYNTSSFDSLLVVPHSHSLPSVFRALKSGDRVLVVWCGYEPIVVSIITKS